jgi:hypothetical protein
VPGGVILEDALRDEWPRSVDGWCFINPPFSALPEFMARTVEQVIKGSRVVALVPAHRCEQEWWHRSVLGRARLLLYPRGRVEYTAPPGVEQSGPAFPSVVVVYSHGIDHNTRAEAL